MKSNWIKLLTCGIALAGLLGCGTGEDEMSDADIGKLEDATVSAPCQDQAGAPANWLCNSANETCVAMAPPYVKVSGFYCLRTVRERTCTYDYQCGTGKRCQSGVCTQGTAPAASADCYNAGENGTCPAPSCQLRGALCLHVCENFTKKTCSRYYECTWSSRNKRCQLNPDPRTWHYFFSN